MEAAREAFPAWSSRCPQERSLILNRLADVLEQSLEELAQAESKDQGDGHLWQDLSAVQDLKAAVHYKDIGSSNPYSSLSNNLPFTKMDHTRGKLVMSSCLTCQGSLHICFSRQ